MFKLKRCGFAGETIVEKIINEAYCLVRPGQNNHKEAGTEVAEPLPAVVNCEEDSEGQAY